MLDKRKFYINGQWVDPIKKNDFEVINPCNEDPFAVISLGSKEDTDLAVKSAKNAFDTWKETSKEERLSLLEKLSSVYKKRFNEMAEAISLEMGAPMDWATDVQTASGKDHLDDFILAMEEIYRILKFGGKLYIKVPYWNSSYTFMDPTHKRGFHENTFHLGAMHNLLLF